MSYEANDDAFPNQAVAFIVSTWGSQSFSSSGILIGRNDVLTASHAIYDATMGGLADDIKIYFSYDPDSTNDPYYSVANQTYYDDFDPDNDGLIYNGDNNGFTLSGAEKDIALLTLSQAAGDIYGWFGIDFSFNSGHVSILGHPGKYNNSLTFDSGNASKDLIDNYIDISSLEVNSGNSGGPIYSGSGNDVSVVGVVSTGVAAASVSAHQSWLTETIVSNDSYIESETSVITSENIIYRFYNTSTETHFYTASSAERDSILSDSGSLNYEGVAFGAASNSAAGLSDLVDVYRFYNLNTGSHFYTASEEERAFVTNNSTHLVFEGTAYRGYQSVQTAVDSLALYRFYNESSGVHFYTASEAEKDSIQTIGTLKFEGIAYYVESA